MYVCSLLGVFPIWPAASRSLQGQHYPRLPHPRWPLGVVPGSQPRLCFFCLSKDYVIYLMDVTNIFLLGKERTSGL